MMREIFEKARIVMVWLGLETNDSASAMRDLRKHTNEAFKGHLGAALRRKTGFGLFFRPFWPRIWIVQEFCVAKQVVFACGNVTTPWDALQESLVESTSRHRDYFLFCSAVRLVWQDISIRGGIGIISDSVLTFCEHQPLVTTLVARQHCDSSKCGS